MNLEKLANLAGVSLSTASKAFSGSSEISEETREHVFNVAKENGCFEKYHRARRDKKVIAVIAPEVESQYYSIIIGHLEQELYKRGTLMSLYLSGFNAKKEAETVSYILSSKCADGIIIIAACSKVKFNKDIPIVAVNTKRDLSEVDCINAAFAQATRDAIKYLIDNGHEKIAYIGDNFTKGKQNMILRALQENGINPPPEHVITEKARFEDAGFNAMEKIYALNNKPTAIFCAYDNIALGAIQSIRMHGQNVPDDFSIIGIDDIPISSHYNVSLTTIRSNGKVICEMAVDLILKKLESKFYTLHQKISLQSELVKRNTVKNIKEKTAES